MRKELDNYLVEKYPKIFVNRYADMKTTAMCWGFSHGDGWFWLLDQLCNSIQSHIDNNSFRNIPQVVASQVKEKYGYLNFYFSGGDDYIDGMVSLAEKMSMNICEECGSLENIGHTSGWIKCICKDCYEIYKNDKINMGSKPDTWKEVELPLKLNRKIKLTNLNQK